MKDNILNLPSDVLGDIFKEIYSEYEKSIRKMFSAPPCEIEITQTLDGIKQNTNGLSRR